MYLPFNLQAYQPQMHKFINSQTHKLKAPIDLQTHQLTNSPTPNSSTHQLTNSTAHQLTNSKPHQLTNSKTHQLINSSTQRHQPTKLKSVTFILQQRSNFHFVLAKLQVEKQAKSHNFQLLMPVVLSVFRIRTCILHHFTFLVWPKARNLSRPKTHFQTPKPTF